MADAPGPAVKVAHGSIATDPSAFTLIVAHGTVLGWGFVHLESSVDASFEGSFDGTNIDFYWSEGAPPREWGPDEIGAGRHLNFSIYLRYLNGETPSAGFVTADGLI